MGRQGKLQSGVLRGNVRGAGVVMAMWLEFFRILKRLPFIRHGDHLLYEHFQGTDIKGRKFVYCPVGRIVSWNTGDYDHSWCHFCKKYYRLEDAK